MRGRRIFICAAAIVAFPVAVLQSQDTARARTQKLDTVTIKDSADFISARLVGFERRRSLKLGTATYFLGADIVKRGTTRLSDALRRALGVWIVDSANVRLVASSRWRKPVGGGFAVGQHRRNGTNLHPVFTEAADLAPCLMQVALDGVLLEWGFSVDELPVNEVHGVEVYPGPASLPAEFGSMKHDGWCGLVMIWTRSR